MKHIAALLLFLFASVSYVPAQTLESVPTRPADGALQEDDERLDQEKTSDQLIAEADLLLDDERLLDARTKLLRALKKDPKNYKAHLLLSGYYLVHVGHFRLALRYSLEAERLFLEQHGQPPFREPKLAMEHGQILYLLSQARLNLDDYPGALAMLDKFSAYGYQAPWYPGTRAWILMKLGRIEEAIRVARAGILAGAEPGRTLNMLGILLSMHGDREESLQIFREAVAWELSQGSLGQPATPLNNAGEVYKELFLDEKAESNWLRATSMPDGCEHVLPSLNVSLMYFDQMNLDGAKKAMDNFESCVAQFPLRNGEEHKALVAFARGRISLLAGKSSEAIEEFGQANKDRQWFGKIGTSEEDLVAAIFQSLAFAHKAEATRLSFTISDSWFSWITLQQEEIFHRVASWWYGRKTRRVLAEDLNTFEDISIRNTDSLLEYPTLGMITAGYSVPALNERIKKEMANDQRPVARAYYDGYLGENLVAHGYIAEGSREIEEAMKQLRPRFDDLFYAHLLTVLASSVNENSPEYQKYLAKLFTLNRAMLHQQGLRLPVRLSAQTKDNEAVTESFYKAGFLPTPNTTVPVAITVTEDGSHIRAVVTAPSSSGSSMNLTAENLPDLINRLTENFFSIDVQ